MADFTKPSHTQSSDEVISDLNTKIQALATMSLNDGSWTNVPAGTVAFDSVTNQFRRKQSDGTWSTVQISLGGDSTLSLGTLTLVANPTSNNQTITAASYKTLTDDVALLKASAIDIQTGTSGTDFNITTASAAGGEVGSLTVTKTINLPDASELARGVVTTGAQTFAGIKTLASGSLQLGNHATSTNNWYITSSEHADGTLRVWNKNYSTGTEILRISSAGNIGINSTNPSANIHINSTAAWTSHNWGKAIYVGSGTPSRNPCIAIGDSSNVNIAAIANSGGSLVFATGMPALTDTSTGSTARMTISSTGRVGIGITSPTYPLSVQCESAVAVGLESRGRSADDVSVFLLTQNSGTEVARIQSAPTYLYINKSGSNPITFSTNGAERLRITGTGNVGIGTTTPAQSLDVAGTAQSQRTFVKNTTPHVGLLDQGTSAAARSAFLYTELGKFYLLRGDKGTESWNLASGRTSWPLEINLDTNDTVIGGTTTAKITPAGNTAAISGGDGTRWVNIIPQLAAGGYNPISTAGNQGIIFGEGSTNTGTLVIAPWANHSSGIKITGSSSGFGIVDMYQMGRSNMLCANGNATVQGQGGYMMYNVDGSGGHTWLVNHSGNAGSGGGFIFARGGSSTSGNFTTSQINSNRLATITSYGDVQAAGEIASIISSNEGGRLSLYNYNKTDSSTQCARWVAYNMTGSYGNGLSFWGYPYNALTTPRISNLLFLGDNNNVGISTQNPVEKLHVRGAIRIQGTSGVVPTYDTGTRIWEEVGYGVHYDGWWHKFTTGTVYNTNTNQWESTAALVIKPGGYVGINDTDPQFPLQIKAKEYDNSAVHLNLLGRTYAAGGIWSPVGVLRFADAADTEWARITTGTDGISIEGPYGSPGSVFVNKTGQTTIGYSATSYTNGTVLLLNVPNIDGGSISGQPNFFYFLQCYDRGTTGGSCKAFIRSDGTIKADGTITGGGADYAECFEWLDGNITNEDRRCVSVVLENEKIRIAKPGEEPIGIISVKPTVLGDSAWNEWKEKYLQDEFGSYILEDCELFTWIDSEGKQQAYEKIPENVVVPEDMKVVKTQRRKLNPQYNPDAKYVPREERKEWAAVGLMGKLRLRKGQVVGSRWVKLRDISENVEEWLVR